MDFNGLIAQVVDTLGSQVTTAQATALLPFAEARFNRLIDHPSRETEAYKTVTADPTLPTDCWRVRDVWLAGSPDVTLEQMSPDAARSLFGNQSGSVMCYTVSGRTLDLWPQPSASSTDVVHIRYQKTIPALSATTTTNWLLDSYPDVYYYGLLVQCEAYIVNDERVGMWKQALDEALSELAASARKMRYGAAPLVRRAYHSA